MGSYEEERYTGTFGRLSIFSFNGNKIITTGGGGELRLCSRLFGHNRDIFFPKPSESLDLTKFSDIAVRYLASLGYGVVARAPEPPS